MISLPILNIAARVHNFPVAEEALGDESLKSSNKNDSEDCHWNWLNFQERVSWVVLDPFFELFSVICIIISTLLLTFEHHGISPELESVLSAGNHVRSFQLVIANFR